jgi:hypothetical protein
VDVVLAKLRKDISGQDLIEYALLAAFAVVAAPAIWSTDYMSGVRGLFAKLSAVILQSINSFN